MLLRAPIKIILAVYTLNIIVKCLRRSIIIRRSQLSHCNNTCSSAVYTVSEYLHNNNNMVVMTITPINWPSAGEGVKVSI